MCSSEQTAQCVWLSWAQLRPGAAEKCSMFVHAGSHFSKRQLTGHMLKAVCQRDRVTKA